MKSLFSLMIAVDLLYEEGDLCPNKRFVHSDAILFSFSFWSLLWPSCDIFLFTNLFRRLLLMTQFFFSFDYGNPKVAYAACVSIYDDKASFAAKTRSACASCSLLLYFLCHLLLRQLLQTQCMCCQCWCIPNDT